MKFITAKTAGFCFGVSRAMNMVEELLNNGEAVATLGPIIHNTQVVSNLEKRGVTITETPIGTPQGATLVIRSHGVAKKTYDELLKDGKKYVDATCPFVEKIHRIARQTYEENRILLIAGDKNHPEIIGIMSFCPEKCFVFSNENELQKLFITNKKMAEMPINVVSQTTFDLDLWKKCSELIKKLCTNAKIFDTICNATSERQQEAASLARRCDLMIVIGGRSSSNSKKLYELCSKYCDCCFIETAAELDKTKIAAASLVGITAGASTPSGIIKEVQYFMSEINVSAETNGEQEVNTAPIVSEPVATAEEALTAETVAAEPPAQEAAQTPVKSFEEMTDEEALEYSLSSMNSDQKVKGVVLGITPTEIQVDIGRKQAGYIPMDEYSADPTADASKELKNGDMLDLIVMRTNDQEGIIMLSKKRFDAIAAREKIYAAADTGEVLEGKVIEIIKGGVLVLCDGVQVFVPASQATVSREDPLEDLLHQTVTFKILEVNRGRRRAVGSIRATMREKRREMQTAFWENIAVGKTYTGRVKSMTSYGAFVDLGGVDGMIHISELSWKRIKNPSEVLNVGDIVEVYVKSFDPEKHRVSLGYKKAEDNPWSVFMRDYKIDDVIDVKIVSMTTYGAFANIIDGIDGLIHISQIADRRIEKPQDVLEVGQTVQAKITAIDEERKRISLSIRALLEPEETEEAEAEDAPTVYTEDGSNDAE